MITLDLDTFFAGLSMPSVTAEIDSNTSAGESGGGDANRATYGTRMWMGTVDINPAYHADADAISAKIQYLQDADVRFEFTPAHLLQESVVPNDIKGIDAQDRRNVKFWPHMNDGAMFDVEFGAGKRSMHRVVHKIDQVPRSGGFVNEYAVVPPLPFGATVGSVVNLFKPRIYGIIIDASLANYQAVLSGTASFKWKQVY